MSAQLLHSIVDFLEPVNPYLLNDDEAFRHTQLGSHIALYDEALPDIINADIVLIGCNDMRGAGSAQSKTRAADAVRKEFYSLYHWHNNVSVADIGNIKTGATIEDTYAAVKAVVNELLQQQKRVVLIGGSHDITLAQYNAYATSEQIIEATCIDARIDLDTESTLPADNFLMPMLTGSPNFIKHYNHIGFQSYFVNPHMLETIDRLRFDCFRVGKAKENMEEMEPVIRNSNMISFDISAIQNSHAPANKLTPNGFTGEEACTLMQHAGFSPNVNSIGIYDYNADADINNLTAKQISHMLWYIMDGIYKGKEESAFDDKNNYNEFHLSFAELDTIFLQSRKTNRWWMQVPGGKYIACSYLDYITASNNNIPERWMRAVERS